tara:strand:+ start:820 stop:1311 length:492 start_codon:yes stop_codon:yes gene_type:complete
MITRDNLIQLYKWARDTSFPCKQPPITEGYSNKIIDYYWLKSIKKSRIIRKKYMTQNICKIYENDEILFSNFTSFREGTVLYPHKDPDILRYPYKRIQIPLSIPDKNKCYMEWVNIKDGKIIWEEGQPQVCDVMHHTHQAFNKSDKPMDFLFIDVIMSTEVEL